MPSVVTVRARLRAREIERASLPLHLHVGKMMSSWEGAEDPSMLPPVRIVFPLPFIVP
jgi:hypothetical protein